MTMKNLKALDMDYQIKKEELAKEILFQNEFSKELPDENKEEIRSNHNINIKEGEMDKEWE